MASSAEFLPVFSETNLGTHIAISVSPDITAGDLKGKLGREHYLCFPNLGEVKVHALMVKRKSCFYHLPDSLTIKNAFQGSKRSWFLRVDATRVKHIHSQVAMKADNIHSQAVTTADNVHSQSAIVGDVGNSIGKEDWISRLTNGTPSVSSSEIISVTGLLTRYFPEYDEQNIFNSHAESMRVTNEQSDQSEDFQMQELGEIHCTNNTDSTNGVKLDMKQTKHKNISGNSKVCLFIDSDVKKSKCNIITKISKRRRKTEMSASVATGPMCLGEMGITVSGYGGNDDNQTNHYSEVEQSEGKLGKSGKKIGISASVAAGLMGPEKKGGNASSEAITDESGAHHCNRDANTEKFRSNLETKISEKHNQIGMSVSGVTGLSGFHIDDLTDDSGSHHDNHNSDIEESECIVGSKINNKCVKGKRLASVVIARGLSKKGISAASDDITHEGHHDSDLGKFECIAAANVHHKHHKKVLSAFITGRTDFSKEGRDALSDDVVEDNDFLQDCRQSDVKKTKCSIASKTSKKCSKNEASIPVVTGLASLGKDGRNAASDNISDANRAHQVHRDESFKSEINGSRSQKLYCNTQSAVKSPSVTPSLPSLEDRSTETPKSKLGRSEVGKRVLQAANELSISTRKQKPLISICRSRTTILSSMDSASLARHVVFEISNDD